ncbi:MAG: Multicopper oxidase MmcO [Chlamydiia bacterium]|nr:Multicopper oxidase MmcO [Chlamydiia bacterium]MCH9615239.1 Multicopper oxidase MmcO [Chlamydiia bacterium]MCH9628439.1 Multicopper oxidase MmcO [Chlamydiia bacterium]
MRAICCALISASLFANDCELINDKATTLSVVETIIKVKDKKSKVFDIINREGKYGLVKKKGECFNVLLDNQTTQPTTIHWHGLILPWREDGVAFVSQYPIPRNQSQGYNFKLVQEGTFWMHSHYGLQEQRLMAAPLIISDYKGNEGVMFLEDFSFKSPGAIWRGLRKNYNIAPPKKMPTPKQSLVDVKYDAYLCNRHTGNTPYTDEVIEGESYLLRIINASAMTNFFINFSPLKAKIVACDGNPTYPLEVANLEIAVAQRYDVLLEIPEGTGSYPIPAIAQGTWDFTGLVLNTKDSPTASLNTLSESPIPRITNRLDKQLKPKNPLKQQKPDRSYHLRLGGDMWRYIWTINGKAWPDNTPLTVREGERVELILENTSHMGHPMHLHGHVFQITNMNGRSINGPIRDTVFVPPSETITIQFDATNPGIWPFHCHFLYHLWGGMFTTVNYENVKPLKFNQTTFQRYVDRYGGR